MVFVGDSPAVESAAGGVAFPPPFLFDCDSSESLAFALATTRLSL